MITKTPAGTLTEYTVTNPPPRVRKGNVTLPQCSGGCGGVGRASTPDYFVCSFCRWRHSVKGIEFQSMTQSRSIAMTEHNTVETETTTPEQAVENVEPAVPADETAPEAPKAKRTPPKPKAKAGVKAKADPKPAAKGGKGKAGAEPKAAKAKPAATADGGETPAKQEKKGLRKPQQRIIAALAKATSPMSRQELAKQAPVDLAMCTEYIGSHDPAVRAKNDAKHFLSLITLGLVKAKVDLRDDKETVVHELTAAGKKAAAKLAE